MPEITEQIPKTLLPYIRHGLDLDWRGREQALGTCPWCDREGKFAVLVADGRWRCYVCQQGSDRGGGNVYTFLRLLWKLSDAQTEDYTPFARSRKLLYPETLAHWGVCKSILNGEWIIPGHDPTGKLMTLYRYARDTKSNRMHLFPTNGLEYQPIGTHLYDAAKPTVYVCEGWGDALALWEVLRSAKRSDDGSLTVTASESASLYAEASVLAVPNTGSIGTAFARWTSLFAGKRVVLLFDSDHPRDHNGVVTPPAGRAAMQRAVEILGRAEQPPKEVSYLHWGELGFDPERASGYDVRDLLTEVS